MSETLAAYEDWIDGIYIKHCGSSTTNGDSLDTSEEYEEWLDDKFDETFNEPDSFISLQIEEKKKQESSSLAGTEQMTASQIRSNRQEATSENKLELVTNHKAFQFQGKSTEVDQAPTASQISSTKQEPSFEATSHPTDNKTLLQDQETFNPEGTENKMVPHTCYVNNQLELDSEITGTNNPYSLSGKKIVSHTCNANNQLELDSEITCTNNPHSLSGHLDNLAEEERDPGSDSMSTWEDITICQLRSSSMLRVPVTLQDFKLQAVVDTAAEVTIISDSIFRELQPKPPYLKKVILHTAGRDLRMDGFVVGPVALKLGKNTFPEAVYVAPIQDDMLLGLDFLLRHGVDIKLDDRCLDFRGNGEKVPIEVDRMVTSKENTVARVTIESTIKVPPNSVLRLQCEISDSLNDYIIEPEGDLDVIVPRTLHSAGSKPMVCLVNITDSFIRLRRNQLVAKAFPVCSISPVSVDSPGEYSISGNDPSILNSPVEMNTSRLPNIGTQEVQQNISLSDPTEAVEAELVEVEGSSSRQEVQPREQSREQLLPDTCISDTFRETEVKGPTDEEECLGHTKELPEHLRDLFQRSIEYLNDDEQDQLAELLIEFEDVFAKSEFDLGDFTDIVHDIDTGSSKPIKQRMRRTPAGFAGEEKAHLEKMLKAGVIKPSISEWASAPVLVRKRDGTVRWCVDYRALNSVTTKDVFPLPLVEDCIDTLAGNQWFSKLDANSAYWQVRVNEQDRKKTAFITRYGLFEHVRMGFGLCNGPATYSRVMNLVLRNLLWSIALAFLDDILVLGSTFSNHLAHIREVLLRFREHKLKLKPKKCILFQKQVDFLGRIVSENGIKLSNTDIKAVLDWPVPQSTREVEQFLGLANYHRTFIKNFARIAVPLYKLTGKNPFVWSGEHLQAFQDLKMALTSAPVLGLPNHDDSFILDTDSSNYAIGGELIQVQGGEERVVAYGSYALTPEQINYCTTRRELLAVIRFTRQFRHYLLGRQFLVRTDHSSLRWLLNFKEPDGQLARWLEELSQYDMVIQHRAGKKHGNADSLSRVQYEDQMGSCTNFRLGVNPEELPCGGCKKCSKAHQSWSHFTEEVDDVVSLTCRQIATGSSIVEIQPLGLEPEKSAEGLQLNLQINESEWPWDFNEERAMPVLEDEGECHLDIIRDGSGEMLVCMAHHMQDHLFKDFEEAEDLTVSEVIREVIRGKGQDTSDLPRSDLLSDLKEGQRVDPDLEALIDYLENKEEPSENNLVAASPAAKYYWINRELFTMEDNLVWRKAKYQNQPKRVVIPRDMQNLVLEMCHDIPAAAHQGVNRTTARVKEKYFWYGMSEAIKNYVATCDVCSRNKKPNRQARCPLTQFRAGAPLERVHIDFLGPLPKTDRGNEHILMIVDQFTKWVECIPLPNQTAEMTAQAIIRDFFTRFGYPFQILSDQGRNFESKLFSALCEAMQIHKTRTTPYRPSCNGQVERCNRTLMDAVRCFVDGHQRNWDLHLAQIAGALRSSVNRSTGFTPNKMMLGREVNQPVDLLFPVTSSPEVSTNEHVAKLQESLRMAHDIARKHLKTSQEIMKRDHDLKVLIRAYNEGDLVYVLDTATIKGQSKKLGPPWKGPGIIVNKFTSYLYRVKLKNAVFTANHDRLKICRDRKLPGWLGKFKENFREILQKQQPDDSVGTHEPVYCICRGPDRGDLMVQCDTCSEWFHGTCVGVTATEAMKMKTYKCPPCRPKRGVRGQ